MLFSVRVNPYLSLEIDYLNNSFALTVPSSHESVQLNIFHSGGFAWTKPPGFVQANSSRNGASNAVSSISIAETELKEVLEVALQKAAEEEENPAEEITEVPSCPLPDLSTSGTHIALLNPLVVLPESIRDANEFRRPCDSIQCTNNSTTLRHMVLGDARQ